MKSLEGFGQDFDYDAGLMPRLDKRNDHLQTINALSLGSLSYSCHKV